MTNIKSITNHADHMRPILKLAENEPSRNDQWFGFWQQVRKKEQRIVDLADRNDLDGLINILEKEQDSNPFDINSNNGLNGWSAMHYAVSNENMEMFKLLMANGGRVLKVQGKVKELMVKLQRRHAMIKNQDFYRLFKIKLLHALKFVTKLGQGSFGEVYKIYDEEKNQFYALKCLSKLRLQRQGALQYAATERKILKKVKSLFVTQLIGAFQNKDHLFLIEELVQGSDLDRFLKDRGVQNEANAAKIIAQVLSGLNDLHESGYIYRDLKPHNVMIKSNGGIKLIDFGLSKQLEKDAAYSFCGSVAYLAPEMVRKLGHDKSLDYYSVGVLLYELLHGKPPYFDATRKKIYQNIIHAKLELKPQLSNEAKCLLKDLLQRDPRIRPSFLQVKMLSFFSKVDFIELQKLQKEVEKIQRPKYFDQPVFQFNERSQDIISKWDWNIVY